MSDVYSGTIRKLKKNVIWLRLKGHQSYREFVVASLKF